MMDFVIKVKDKKPVGHAMALENLRQIIPDFPLDPSPETLASHGLAWWRPTPTPTLQLFEEYETVDPVADENGIFHQTYRIFEMSDEKKQTVKNVIAGYVRERRNQLLRDSDWSQGQDIPPTVAKKWAEYRQKLRDFPQQPNFPLETQWPVPPDNDK